MKNQKWSWKSWNVETFIHINGLSSQVSIKKVVCVQKNNKPDFWGARCQSVWFTITKKNWDKKDICHSKENSMQFFGLSK